MWAPSTEIRALFFLAAGIAAFIISYRSGNTSRAISIPAFVASIGWMIPVLADPKAFSELGFIALIVLVFLAFIPFCLASAVGCVAGSLLRQASRATNKPSARQWGAIGILVAAIVFAGMQVLQERNFRSFQAVAEVSGASFLRQQEAVLAKTGPVVNTFVFAKGHNQHNLPVIMYFVEGEKRDADVHVEASGTESAPVYSIRSVELRPENTRR